MAVGIGIHNQDILEDEPSWAYFSAEPFRQGGGFSPMQQKYWRGQQGDIWNEFLGHIGQSTRRGERPMLWTDFLEDMPWTERYTALGPSMRPGGSQRRFNPSVRYAYT